MAKPKLCLIPAAQGDKFYSVLPSSGVGDFDFTRSGGATRINAQGLIETVADGVSRLNYPLIDGKVVGCPSHLLENSATNLIPYSEDFTKLTKTNTIITSNQAISPDGTQNADELTGSGFARAIYAIGNGDITVSCYVKSNDGADKNFVMGAGSLGSLGNETFTATSEWQRFTHTFSTTAQSTDFGFFSTGGVALGLYLYGFQLEQGSYPTSYIPTNGQSGGVTRSAETANNSGDASTFNDSEGVLMAEISALDNDGTYRGISVSDGNIQNWVLIYINNVNNQLRVNLSSGGNVQANLIQSVTDATTPNKVAIRYSLNNVSFWLNGLKVLEDLTSVTMPIGLNRLNFDSTGTGLEKFYGNTKQLQYFDSALNDSDLEKLTSWVSFTDMANGQLYTIE